jgi:DNA repair exonuclease SbcCD nuclease subunit
VKLLISSDHHHHAFASFASIGPQGVSSRLQEGLDAEAQLEHIIATQQIDWHCRLGDLFDRKNVLDAVTFNEVMTRIATTKCETLLLCGNHDHAAGGVRNSIESFSHLPAVRVVQNVMCHHIDDTDIYAIPYTDDPGLLVEALTNTHPNPERCNILFAHLGVNGAKTGSEFRIPSMISLEMLQREKFDHVFLGHYHEPQQLAENVQYVGSLIQRSFSDAGRTRRALVFDTVTGALEEMPIAGPSFIIKRVAALEELPQLASDLSDVVGTLYLKVATPDPRITRTLVEHALQRQCGGVVVAHEVSPASTASTGGSFVAPHVSWESRASAWVAQAETSLEKSGLEELGHELIHEALSE